MKWLIIVLSILVAGCSQRIYPILGDPRPWYDIIEHKVQYRRVICQTHEEQFVQAGWVDDDGTCPVCGARGFLSK
jgi:hypothetical protein